MKTWLDKKAHWLLLAPFLILFAIFILLPVLAAVGLSFTYFNTVQTPSFAGLQNYISLMTKDPIFLQKVLPNTFKFAVIVGPGGFILSFFMAWLLAQLTRGPRTVLAVILYSPSMIGGVTMSVVWKVIFSSDQAGYLNSMLLSLGAINEPIKWLQSEKFLMPIMILVSLWSSMGVGFLAMLSGVINGDREIYEAAYIDGVSNRFQEIMYITIPTMKPQMLFGAVMAIVNTFQSAGVGVALSGANPTPGYAGQLIVTHIDDYGFIRYEMGYAAAVSVVLLVGIYLLTKGANKVLGSKDE